MRTKLLKHLKRVVLLVAVVILIVPQFRMQFQIMLHKGLSYLNRSTTIEVKDRKTVNWTGWRLKSHSDAFISSQDLENEVVFINFWATWCPPCIAEMPELEDLYNSYTDKVIFLFITDDDIALVKKFKNKHNYSFEVYQSLTEIPEDLQTTSIPRTFIINKKGEIVVDEKGAIQWNSNEVKAQIMELLIE